MCRQWDRCSLHNMTIHSSLTIECIASSEFMWIRAAKTRSRLKFWSRGSTLDLKLKDTTFPDYQSPSTLLADKSLLPRRHGELNVAVRRAREEINLKCPDYISEKAFQREASRVNSTNFSWWFAIDNSMDSQPMARNEISKIWWIGLWNREELSISHPNLIFLFLRQFQGDTNSFQMLSQIYFPLQTDICFISTWKKPQFGK